MTTLRWFFENGQIAEQGGEFISSEPATLVPLLPTPPTPSQPPATDLSGGQHREAGSPINRNRCLRSACAVPVMMDTVAPVGG